MGKNVLPFGTEMTKGGRNLWGEYIFSMSRHSLFSKVCIMRAAFFRVFGLIKLRLLL